MFLSLLLCGEGKSITGISPRKSLSTNWMGGWVGPSAFFASGGEEKNPCACRKSNPGYPALS
jgi:hypothetical protein